MFVWNKRLIYPSCLWTFLRNIVPSSANINCCELTFCSNDRCWGAAACLRTLPRFFHSWSVRSGDRRRRNSSLNDSVDNFGSTLNGSGDGVVVDFKRKACEDWDCLCGEIDCWRGFWTPLLWMLKKSRSIFSLLLQKSSSQKQTN